MENRKVLDLERAESLIRKYEAIDTLCYAEYIDEDATTNARRILLGDIIHELKVEIRGWKQKNNTE